MNKFDNQKLIIIDAYALIHRSFHALPLSLKTPQGLVSNAVYGFSSFLLKSLNEIKPNLAIVAFDTAEKTFRHQMYQEYKATRTKAPDELYQQIPLIKEVLKAFNVPILEKDGFEADDIIGTVAKLAYQQNIKSTIITGDLDTLQLVNDKVKVYTMSRGLNESVLYDVNKVKERYNLSPKQIIDLKALKGDPSDNISGVKGIGEKGAINLLTEFSDLTTLFQAVKAEDKRIKARTLKLLKEQEEQAWQSYQLVEINKNVDLDIDWTTTVFPQFSKQAVVKIFQKFGFNSLLNKIQTIETQEKEEKFNFKLVEIKKESEIPEAIKNLASEKILSLCIAENKALLASNNNYNYVIDFQYLKYFSPLFASEIKKIAYDFKQIIKLFIDNKIEINNIYFDLLIAHYLLFPNQRIENNQSLIFKELGIGEYDKNYQAIFNLKIFKKLKKALEAKNIYPLFKDVEIPLIKILAQMELNGIKIDLELLKKIKQENEKEIKELKNKIESLAQKKFNLNSSQQLSDVLFNDLKISSQGIKKTKTGLSTADEELNKLQDKHEIIKLIQNYRELYKLQSTYLLPIEKLSIKGFLYTNWQQAVVSTGRLSSTEPNLQNLPIKTKLGRKIRELFIAPFGYKLLGFDYSQIELRITAHLSNEESLINAFVNNIDIHTQTASLIYQVPTEKVSEEMRQKAKAINFGIIYGQGAHGLSVSSGLNFKEAKDFITRYFQKLPKVKEMIDKQINLAKKTQSASTLFGRTRPLLDINSNNYIAQKAAERMAINMPIQGTAADMIKLAMIEIDKQILRNNDDIKLILQIHDELVFQVKKTSLDQHEDKIKKIMEEIVDLNVPIIINSKRGDNLAQLK